MGTMRPKHEKLLLLATGFALAVLFFVALGTPEDEEEDVTPGIEIGEWHTPPTNCVIEVYQHGEWVCSVDEEGAVAGGADVVMYVRPKNMPREDP